MLGIIELVSVKLLFCLDIGSILWCSNRSSTKDLTPRANKPCRKGKAVPEAEEEDWCIYNTGVVECSILHIEQKY